MTTNVTKIALLLIAAVMLVSIAFAGVASADYTLKGSGTEDDPYQISTALDMYNLSQNTSYFQGGTDTKHFKLMNDISISNITSVVQDPVAKTVTISTSTPGKSPLKFNWNDGSFNQPNWNPGFDESVASKELSSWSSIGNASTPVTSKITFDGDGHTISGLFINVSTSVNGHGLFGYLSDDGASINITNLKLDKAFVWSSALYVGGLVGGAGSNAIQINITQCTVTDSAVLSGAPTTGGVGGLIGSLANSVHLNASYCNVKNNTIFFSSSNVGGLVGAKTGLLSVLNTSHCNIEDCNIIGLSNVGGIVGQVGTLGSAQPVTASDCHVWRCNIIGNANIGGVYGDIQNNGVIIRCEVADCDNISGKYQVGGFIGNIRPKTPNPATINIYDSTVARSTISGSDITSSCTMGGAVGSAVVTSHEIRNNTLDTVTIKPNANAEYAYLFDLTKYKIHSTNGTAKLAQINLLDDNTIINSYVLNETHGENTVLEGFTDVKDKLVSINVSNPKVTSIAKDAFKWDSGKGIYSTLQEITGLDSITSVGDSAFEECHELTSIDLKNAKTIGKNAFKQSNSMKAICLRNVETIGDSAFEGCSSLMETVVSYYGDLASYVPPQKMSFPKTLKSIGKRAFYGCSNFGNVNGNYFPIEIPEGTTSIGDEAFYSCENICSITVPSTVTSVGKDVFGKWSEDGSTDIGIYDKEGYIYSKGIIYDNTGKLITNKTFNDHKNIAAVLVNSTTLEYKFLYANDLLSKDYNLSNLYWNAPGSTPTSKNLSVPNFMGWSTVPGIYIDETKAENTTQLLSNDTGKYYYLYQVWDDETIYTLQQVYLDEPIREQPLPGEYVDRNGDGSITYEDGYNYKIALKYGVKQIPLYGDDRKSGYTYQYHLWALKYNSSGAFGEQIEKVEDLIKPGTDRYLKPNVVVTYEDGTVVRYTDSEGRYVYNGSDPFFGSLYTDFAIEEIETPIPPSSSSHRETGYTVILPENTTATPTPTATPGVPTIAPTTKPTTNPTQKSPAPFVGILAGLGAVALLMRMRR